jgi:hypothetical protein
MKLVILGEDVLFSMPRAKLLPSAVALTSVIVGEDPALNTPWLLSAPAAVAVTFESRGEAESLKIATAPALPPPVFSTVRWRNSASLAPDTTLLPAPILSAHGAALYQPPPAAKKWRARGPRCVGPLCG